MATPASTPPPPPSAYPAIPPPVPGWTPPPPAPSKLAMAALEGLVVSWGRILGFLLLFIGTLVAVVAGSVEPVCYASSACTNYGMTWAWAVIVAEVLWTIGLFFLGGTSGIRLMRELKAPMGGTPEEFRWVLTERWFNFLLLALTIVLLWFLLSGVVAIHPGFSLTGTG